MVAGPYNPSPGQKETGGFWEGVGSLNGQIVQFTWQVPGQGETLPQKNKEGLVG